MKRVFTLLFFALSVAFVACSKDDKTEVVDFRFATPVVQEVGATSATVSCSVPSASTLGSIPVAYAYGLESEGLDEYAIVRDYAVSGNTFTSRLTGLQPQTRYKLVAFLQMGTSRIVSDQVAFATRALNPGEVLLEITSLKTIPATAEAGAYSILYQVTNGSPDSYATASTSSQTPWVNSFDNSTRGEIAFDVDANTGAERTAVITVAYPGAESVQVSVVQRASSVTPPPTEDAKTITMGRDAAEWPATYGSSTPQIGQFRYQLKDVSAGYGNGIQFKKVSGAMANAEDMGAIRRVELTYTSAATTKTLKLALGDQKQPSSFAMATSYTPLSSDVDTRVQIPGVESNGKVVFDCTSYDYHYFTLGNATQVAYLESIEIVCGGTGGPTPAPAEPKFITPSYNSLTKNSAMILCSYTYTGDKTPTDAYFLYAAPGGAEQRVNVASSTPGDKSASLSGLTSSTRYTFRLCVVVDGKTFSSQAGAFTTLDESGTPPTPGIGRYPGWAELPTEDASKINSEYFYAYHLCPDYPSSGRKARNFTTCYSKGKRCPVWVAAPLHDCYTGRVERTDAYRSDPDIKCTQAGKWTGYTRGHMLGSNERRVTTNVNRDVFYWSNIAPQNGTYFNTGGGQWNTGEDWVDKQWRNLGDTLYQVVGCYWANENKVVSSTVIPTHFYTVLLRAKKSAGKKWVVNCTANELQAIAIFMEHRAYSKGEVVKPADFKARGIFKTVAEIEAMTGHKFFVNVPNVPKESFNTADWNF